MVTKRELLMKRYKEYTKQEMDIFIKIRIYYGLLMIEPDVLNGYYSYQVTCLIINKF